jgi:predicted transcriptional regulator
MRRSTAPDVRKELAGRGRDLAYTTAATIIHVLCQPGGVQSERVARLEQF